ncbi:MAG TPA: SIMPL domain-containing protein [Candidatus Elarobacter sp.]|jgi:hypothetical protein
MKPFTAALAALIVLAAAVPAGAQIAAARPLPPILNVTGQGSVDRAPDRVVVTFTITTNDDNATRATSANNAAYATLAAKLGGLGLSGAAVRTTSYNVNYNLRPPKPDPAYAVRYGYIVTRSVRVTSDRTDQAGAIVDAGVASGITEVGSIAFTLRDPRAAQRAALAAAVADADAQARTIAEAAHVRIVRIANISSNTYPVGPRPLSVIGRTASMASVQQVPTEVQPSDLTVNATVSFSYEIAP